MSNSESQPNKNTESQSPNQENGSESTNKETNSLRKHYKEQKKKNITPNPNLLFFSNIFPNNL